MRSELLLLSKLDDKPAFYYHAKSNTKICYWNGVAMTRNQAVAVIAKVWGFTWVTREMQHSTWQEYLWAYKTGAFGHDKWGYLFQNFIVNKDNHINKMISWLSANDKEFPMRVSMKYSKQEALEWIFDTDLAEID